MTTVLFRLAPMCVLALLAAAPAFGDGAETPSAVGLWQTIDDETNKPKSHVRIEKEGGELVGRIVHLIDPKEPEPVCTECDGEKHDKPIVGLEIMWDLRKKTGKDKPTWEGGSILDPKNGKTYDCKIWLEDPNTLTVRGSFLFIGRNQTWHRIDADGERI
mgnify:FL=1